MEYPTMYHAAIEYAKHGLAVFPLVEKGKLPLSNSKGCHDATTDAAQIKYWWQETNPNYNIGIATGKKSGGLVVIDLDIDNDKGIDGYNSLRDWERENGELPETVRSITGRGGCHIFYKDTKSRKNRSGIIDGVDIRGEGGYIVAPPSVHKNGRRYEWEYGLDDAKIADANHLVDKLLEIGEKSTSVGFKMPDKIKVGERNEILFRFACMMQAKGASDQTVYAATMSENENGCEIPLEEKQVKKIVKQALKYEKGKPIYFNEEGKATQGWREPQFTTNEKGMIKQTIENICEAIEYDPQLYGKIRYNTLSYSQYVVGELPWEHLDKHRMWSNTDDSQLRSYIEAKYGLSSSPKIIDALNIVSSKNKYNPVLEMLNHFYKKWDKKTGHIENLMPDYLGVEKTEYTTEVMKLFMLGAISRAFTPGCKFDYVPILVGDQAAGKSLFSRILSGNKEWFNDNLNTIEGDRAFEKLSGSWIVELAELLATKKAKEVEAIKAFLTSTADIYRPAYGRVVEHRKRTCVFIGTTNEDRFLTDRTGNRRFLPIIVRKDYIKKFFNQNMEAAELDFKNAWGEAMNLYKKADENPNLVLPKHLEEYVQSVHEQHLEDDPLVGIIQEWLDDTHHIRVCVPMLHKEALGNDKNPARFESNHIHKIMKNQIKGWMQVENNSGKAKCGQYGVQVCYERRYKDEIPY